MAVAFGRRAAVVALLTLLAVSLPAADGGGAPSAAGSFTATAGRWQPAGDGWHHSAVVPADGVALVGADLDGDRRVAVRARRAGDWSPWRSLRPAGDHGPDPGTAEARGAAAASEPVWTGPAEALQVRTDRPRGGPVRLTGVRFDGDLGWRPDARGPAAAEAQSRWPPVVPRHRWDPAGECQPTREPRYASGVSRAYVHHTEVPAHYDPDEADDILRAICRFHVRQRGFSDIGYNFLIDQYGVIYQGRLGGVLGPVVGAHAQGFNRGSVGIAVVGEFEHHEVPAAAIASLERLLTWLSEQHGLAPRAVTPHVSTGGRATRFARGATVALPTVVGHRQTGVDTVCPGVHLFARLHGPGSVTAHVADALRERGVSTAAPDAVDVPPGTVLSPPPLEVATKTVERVVDRLQASLRQITGTLERDGATTRSGSPAHVGLLPWPFG